MRTALQLLIACVTQWALIRDANRFQEHLPPLARQLKVFLTGFIQALPQQEKGALFAPFTHTHTHTHFFFPGLFLTGLIAAMAAMKIADVPLLYISYSLSELPPCPTLRPPGLAALRCCLSAACVCASVMCVCVCVCASVMCVQYERAAATCVSPLPRVWR